VIDELSRGIREEKLEKIYFSLGIRYSKKIRDF
jgi:hypothetical protein